MNVVDERYAKHLAYRQEILDRVADVIVLQGKPCPHPLRKPGEIRSEPLQRLRLPPLSASGVDIDDIRPDHLGDKPLVFQFRN